MDTKVVGRKKQIDLHMPLKERLTQAEVWLETVRQLRGERGVCKKGLYKFETFEEADQWMEMMISASTREYRP